MSPFRPLPSPALPISDGASTKIFLLHGWSTNPESLQKWAAFEKLLQQKGFETTVLKTPGLSAPLHEVWNLDNYVEWLSSHIAHEERVILLGHSFGGQIAIRYAATHNNIEKLILIDSAGIRDYHLLPTIRRKIFFVAAKTGKIFFHYDVFRNALYKLARERDYQNAPPLLRRTMSTILDDEVIDNLPHVHASTLILWGENDRVTPLHLAHFFQQNIPHAQLKIIAEARHSPQFTHGEEVSDLVADFVKEKKEK